VGKKTAAAAGGRIKVKQIGSTISCTEGQRATVRGRRFDSIAVHGMYGMAAALENAGSIMEPAFLTPAQHFADSDSMEATLSYLAPGWVYSRIATPTLGFLEETLALLEGYGFDGETACCSTSSGMAAIMKEDAERWRGVIRAAGVKPE